MALQQSYKSDADLEHATTWQPYEERWRWGVLCAVCGAHARYNDSAHLLSCLRCGVLNGDEVLERIEQGEATYSDGNPWLFEGDPGADPSPPWLRGRLAKHEQAPKLRGLLRRLYSGLPATAAARLAYDYAMVETDLPRAAVLRIIDDEAGRAVRERAA